MKKNGFTLIELAITTAIFTFMIVSMTIALQQQQKQFNVTKEVVDIDQTGRAILDLIASDIRNSAARQGKDISLTFVNGGSDLSDGVDIVTGCADEDTSNSGSSTSPPDCISILTWDITRGMTFDSENTTTDLPSTASIPTLKQLTVPEGDDDDDDAPAPEFTLTLDDKWFDENGDFIGGTLADDEIILGFRSRTKLCNKDSDVNCVTNPEQCSECSAVIKGEITQDKLFKVNDIEDVLFENFPVDFTNSSLDQFVSGVDKSIGENESNVVKFGFVPTISSQSSEMSIVNVRTYRIDQTNRELELIINQGNPQPLAGGQVNTQDGLESPGIVDLQFIFNLQDQDGKITKVGACELDNEGKISTCHCNTADKNHYQNFTCGDAENRELDIRSVEIYVVLKSKIKPNVNRGEAFNQEIPQIGDVKIKEVTEGALEPEEGYIYRVYSTTVYLRNISREDFA